MNESRSGSRVLVAIGKKATDGAKRKISILSSPHFLLPANQFPLGSLQVAKKLQQRSHLIIVLSVLFILSFLDGYFHFLGP